MTTRNASHPRSRFGAPAPTAVLLLGLLVGVAAGPRPVEAQFTVDGTCSTLTCGPFEVFLSSLGPPLFLDNLSLSFLTPGWAFADASFQAEDAFLPPFAGTGTLSGGGASIFLDFLAAGGGLFVDPAAGASVTLTVSGSGAATVGFEATDDLGDSFVGTFQTAVVPEPGTLLLLATGLAGLALVRRRRREDDPGGAA